VTKFIQWMKLSAILDIYWTTRGYANLRIGHLADWSTRGLDNAHTGQLADATGDFACLIFVLLAASARPRVVQLPTSHTALENEMCPAMRTPDLNHVVQCVLWLWNSEIKCCISVSEKCCYQPINCSRCCPGPQKNVEETICLPRAQNVGKIWPSFLCSQSSTVTLTPSPLWVDGCTQYTLVSRTPCTITEYHVNTTGPVKQTAIISHHLWCRQPEGIFNVLSETRPLFGVLSEWSRSAYFHSPAEFRRETCHWLKQVK